MPSSLYPEWYLSPTIISLRKMLKRRKDLPHRRMPVIIFIIPLPSAEMSLFNVISTKYKCLKIWWMGKYTIKSNYKRRYHCESTTIIRITLIQMSMCCYINDIEDICMLFKWYIIYFLYIRIVIENNHEHGTKIISFRHTDILRNPHEWQSLYRQDRKSVV